MILSSFAEATADKHKNSFEYSSIEMRNPITFLEISSSAFNHNATYYKNLIGLPEEALPCPPKLSAKDGAKSGPHNKLGAVIKGNGYGHGLHQMAYLCEQNQHIDWILVAQLSEGLALQNISKPILVLGYSDMSPEFAVNKNIHFMIDNLECANNLHDIGKKHSYQFNVHVKIDTGLSRMGILAHDAIAFIQQLKKLTYLNITGIYSHFSASDTNPAFTTQQYDQFNEIIAELHTQNINIPYIHMSNSAAVSTVAYQPHFNFFRIGVGLYGLGYDKAHLQPIMTWKTRIANIKTVPAHSYVSYCGDYQTTRLSRLALLPIGYYDGYIFRFSNKTSVLINGALAPVVGRVAMNMTIVDITDITAQTGDEVILMGPYPGIGAYDLAHLADIKNVREIIVGINPALTRVITE